jgi:CheY-like chemotaxis protein
MTQTPTDRAGHLILTVDDEPDFLVTYARLLRIHNLSVVPNTSVHQALTLLGRDPFALVVTDLRLSDGDGLDVVRATRALHPAPPVIAVTGFASAESQRAAFAAGVQAYLVKPFSVESFTSLVCALLADQAGVIRARVIPR